MVEVRVPRRSRRRVRAVPALGTVRAVTEQEPATPAGKRSYAVVGLGAIGGYYGARLAAAGHPVHFLARSDAEHVRRHGLIVESPFGDIHLPDVSVFTAPEEVPPVDVVVLAVKTTDTEQAAKATAPILRDGTVVLVLQNGLGIEAAIADALEGTPVVGGMCFICSNKVGPGHVRHLDYGAVTVGEHTDDPRGAGITAAVDAIASDLEAAGLPTSRIENLVTGRWRKLVWNIPYNGLSVVLDAGTDELMKDPATRALVEELMVEVLEAAEACGHRIESDFIDYMMRTTDKMTPYKTSMKLDYEGGRPLEIDTIYGAPIDAARAAGYQMVRTAALYAQLQFLDARNRGIDLDRKPRPERSNP
jgi:2-dehydropantoate 2-reductase